MTGSLPLLIAYALDLAFGEPPNAIHPVAWMGTVIARGKRWALVGSPIAQLARGAVLALAVPSASAAVAYALIRAVHRLSLLELIVTVLLLKPMFAVRALGAAAFRVRDALERQDIVAARRALGSLCSRRADELDAEQLVAATIESVAENTSDSFIAPLLFFAFAGVPGAAFYRATNTLDAMVGYHGTLEYAGKASARLDDLANLVPARVTASLLLVAGLLRGESLSGGVRVLLRDARKTESPNAGWPMAAMAGLLGVRLEKVEHYALGDATRSLSADRITAAWRVASLACTLAVGIAVCTWYWVAT